MPARRPSSELVDRARRVAESAARAADRAARAHAAQPQRDPTGEHHATISAVAQRSGRDVVEYDGAASRADAEREAAAEVEQMFAPRQPALPWES